MADTKILLVDDDQEVLKVLESQLKKIAPIDTAESAEAAIVHAEKTSYAVVVSDFKMPGKNGLELLSYFAETQPLCQRILLTAFSELADLKLTINKAKLNFLLSKPWDAVDLIATVENSLKQYLLSTENKELRKMAWTDALTEVSNNRYFWARVASESERANRYERPLSLILLDIDDFKKFNDQYGHPTGDRVLKSVAKSLEHSLRTMDTLSRYGGEEFTIILPETDSKIALTIAKRLLERVKKETDISLSMGVAEFPKHAKTPQDLVNKADKALLEAKRKGKARALVYQD